MKIFRNYKKLYESEKALRCFYEMGIGSLQTDIANSNIKSNRKTKELKEEIARLKIELEDTKGFLEQEKACSSELRKQKANLQRVKTRYEHQLKSKKEDE